MILKIKRRSFRTHFLCKSETNIQQNDALGKLRQNKSMKKSENASLAGNRKESKSKGTLMRLRVLLKKRRDARKETGGEEVEKLWQRLEEEGWREHPLLPNPHWRYLLPRVNELLTPKILSGSDSPQHSTS